MTSAAFALPSASSARASPASTGGDWSRPRIPTEFVQALTERRLAGGADSRGVRRRRASDRDAASAILEEINASGGNAGACHAQMYMMGTLLRHGSEEQKRR